MSRSQEAQGLFARGRSLLRGKEEPHLPGAAHSPLCQLLQSPHLAHPAGALPVHSTAARPAGGSRRDSTRSSWQGRKRIGSPQVQAWGCPPPVFHLPTKPSWASTLKALKADCWDEAFLERPRELYVSAHNTEKGKALYKRWGGERGEKNKQIHSIHSSLGSQ